MDVHDKKARSYNMSQIKGKDTKPEKIVRKYLFAQGFRYRKNDKRLPGTPDVVLPKYKTVIFVNGCFWHAHQGCKWFVPPKSNSEFWQKKFAYNIERDEINYKQLRELGWKIVIIWECEIRHGDAEIALKKLTSEILGKKE